MLPNDQAGRGGPPEGIIPRSCERDRLRRELDIWLSRTVPAYPQQRAATTAR